MIRDPPGNPLVLYELASSTPDRSTVRESPGIRNRVARTICGHTPFYGVSLQLIQELGEVCDYQIRC